MKKLLLSVLAIATLVMCFALTSCGECEHVWGEWTDTGAATCSGTAQKRVCKECEEVETRTNGDAKAHTWGAWTVKTAAGCITAGQEERACSKCSAKESRPIAALGHKGDAVCEVCYNAIFTLPEIDFSEYKSVKVSLKDFTLTLDYTESKENSGTMTLDICEGYVGLDENDELVGAFKAVIKMAAKNTGFNNNGSVVGYIEDGVLYIGAEGNPVADDNLNSYRSYMKYDLSAVEESEQLEMIEEKIAMAEALLPDIQEWYEDVFAPIFGDVSVDTEGASKFAVKFINGIIKKEAASDGSFTLTLDYDAIKDFNALLGEKKISELIDVIFEEGVYADLKEYFTSDEFYAFSVADVISYIETEQGIDLAKLVEALDALIAIVYPVPEGQTAPTVSAMLAGYIPDVDPTEFDLVAFLKDETMADYSIMFALQMALGAQDDPETEDVDEAAAAVKGMVEGLFTQAEANTLYDLIAGMVMGGGSQSAPLSDTEEPDPVAMMVEMIDEYIDQMAEMSTYTLYFDKNGAFVKSVLTITAIAPDSEVSAIITATESKVTVDIELDIQASSTNANGDMTLEILPNGSVTIEANAIAAIKAAFAKVPTIDKTTFFNIIKGELYDPNSDVVYIEGNTLYLLRFDGINYTYPDFRYYINLVCYKFEYTGQYSQIEVEYGCKNWINVDLKFANLFGKMKAEIEGYNSAIHDRDYYVDTYFNVDTDAGLQNFKAIFADGEMNDAFYTESSYVDFNYNTETKEYEFADNDYTNPIFFVEQIYCNGHLYIFVEAESDLDKEEGELVKHTYKCQHCNEKYTYYYTKR